MSDKRLISLQKELADTLDKKMMLRQKAYEKARSIIAQKNGELQGLREQHAALLDKRNTLDKKLFKPRKKLSETEEELRSLESKIEGIETDISMLLARDGDPSPETIELSDRAEKIRKEIAAEERNQIAGAGEDPHTAYDFAN